ncbi:MAG: hypothetical protein QF903_10375 [Planctomycetota bacterium]|jgi:hypothetical protein|nr:hypothetical protein [Planctomycetota bacterium]MDP6763143.1 hypothetical protein [Planctomycetota bacterium]MDP6989873.1 hypothetical protein [Planctomycetota bacterium]
MKRALLAAAAAQALLLTPNAWSQATMRDFQLDTAASAWTWTAQALGINAVPVTTDAFNLSGTLQVSLGTNASGEVSEGQFVDGSFDFAPDMEGSFPGLGISFHMHSVNLGFESMQLDFGNPATSTGSFQGDAWIICHSALVTVTLPGGGSFDIDLAGLTSNPQNITGQFTVGSNGLIRLDSPQSHPFTVTEPNTGIDFDFTVTGLMAADEFVTLTSYCFGDGSGTTCPCANGGGPGEGCGNGNGPGAVLGASGTTSIGAGDLVLAGSQLIASQPGLYFQGNNAVNGGNGVTFGDGLRCAGGNVVRLQVRVADSGGNSSTTIDIGAAGGVSAGDTKRYQLWYRDPQSSPCGSTFNLTGGIEAIWGP